MAYTQYTKNLLSASTNGKGIKVTATATTGTTIHTAVAGTTSVDEVWLYAANNGTTSANLTLEWGSTTAPDNNILIYIPAYGGLQPIAPGLLLNGGLLITAFASVANVITIYGYVNTLS